MLNTGSAVIRAVLFRHNRELVQRKIHPYVVEHRATRLKRYVKQD